MSGGLRRRATTVQIDKRGTARLGGVIPLRDEKVRGIALVAAKHLNGGTVAVVADKRASLSNIVQVLDWIRNADSTQPLGPPQRQAGAEKR
jgi:biopolymer transport protein ExbD